MLWVGVRVSGDLRRNWGDRPQGHHAGHDAQSLSQPPTPCSLPHRAPCGTCHCIGAHSEGDLLRQQGCARAGGGGGLSRGFKSRESDGGASGRGPHVFWDSDSTEGNWPPTAPQHRPVAEKRFQWPRRRLQNGWRRWGTPRFQICMIPLPTLSRVALCPMFAMTARQTPNRAIPQ